MSRIKSSPVRLFRSSAFRLAALQAVLFASVCVVLFVISWWAMRNYIEHQLRQTISDESEEMAARSPQRRLAAIQQSLSQSPRATFDYGLYARDGRRIAGDLAQEPAAAGWSTIRQDDWNHQHGHIVRQIYVLATTLQDGQTLVVGRGWSSAARLDLLLKRSFMWSGLVVALLALLGGVVTARSYLRRVEVVATAASRIAAGDLTARISSSGRDDEFDRLALALNGMLDRIELLMDGMRQISNDIAHDLRTPFTHLRQGLEKGIRGSVDSRVDRRVCERALEDVDGILETFTALLRIAHVESRQRLAGFTTVDLSRMLASLADDYGLIVEGSGQVLRASVADGLHVHGDEILLTEMFVNLLENAVHHAPGAAVSLTLIPLGAGCRVTIDDGGPGIPAHERERVLRRFVRLDASRNSPGSGLGLALVAAVAELHCISLVLGDALPGLRVQLDFPGRVGG